MNDSLHDASSEEYSEISEDSSTMGDDPLANVHMDDDDDDDDDSAAFSTGVERSDMKEVRHLVKKETRHVQRWRCVVLLVLLSAAAIVTTLTYTALQREDEENLETSQVLFAETIHTAMDLRLQEHLEYMNGLSNRFSSLEEWPFVSLPEFWRDASDHISVEQVSFIPFLQGPEEVAQWTAYSMENRADIPRHQVYNYVTNDNDGTTKEFPIETGEDDNVVAPYWQFSPKRETLVNFNAMNHTWFPAVRERIIQSKEPLVLPFSPDYLPPHQNAARNISPRAVTVVPILERRKDKASDVVGLLLAVLGSWDEYILHDIPLSLPGGDDVAVSAVLSCSNSTQWTYELYGRGETVYVGEGDLHNANYNSLKRIIMEDTPSGCFWSVYPTANLASQYESRTPLYLTLIVAFAFGMMTLFFAIYEGFVQRQNSKIMSAAAQFNKVVSSLFPSNLRNRLFNSGEESGNLADIAGRTKKKNKRHRKIRRLKSSGPEKSLSAFLHTNDNDNESDICPDSRCKDEIDALLYRSKPIADLYTDCTILFADIVGFTAWSSVREPVQVFILLETLYRAFDSIAKKRKVFKVETVGDCYVAVTGLPDPRPDHAIAMARFAHDCLQKMKVLSHKLEVRLGPDTGDLSMRVGMHSGPVTAGVLRGEKSRFQLFGDTMNTASRMESTGSRDRIQVSQETADLLVEAGKGRWLTLREDIVIAKGKGEMTTYWLENVSGSGSATAAPVVDTQEMNRRKPVPEGLLQRSQSAILRSLEGSGNSRPVFSDKTNRLINWNVEVLRRLLKLIVARRNSENIAGNIQKAIHNRKMSLTTQSAETVLDEVKEIIAFPDFTSKNREIDIDSIDLGEKVDSQVYEYVVSIAAMYRENPFHSIDHASHVTMSVTKLLSRIIAPPSSDEDTQDHTYGITADPLTQFACVFSALIHDVDHSGVPNTQLIKERPDFSAAYNNKAIAEQNSVDLAWLLLQDDQYTELRQTIYTNQAEKQRFRQLVVNSVMATDIMDKDLKQLRNARWEKAFAEQKPERRSSFGPGLNREQIHRKATIVIEHLIQASDVAHTMQHWHIYRKWNERLFFEMSLAHFSGRSAQDPAENWYKGELGFFDFYIIPLAKKLKDCGVFGVSSDEYLNYAQKNRREWETRGQEVVAEMLEKFRKQYGDVIQNASK